MEYPPPVGSDLLEATLNLVDAELTANDLINHPHNPTELCWKRVFWSHYILKWSERASYVIVDDSFIDFHRDAEAQSAYLSLWQYAGIKSDGRKKDRWSVKHLAQIAAAWAYLDQTVREETHSWLPKEKQFIHDTWDNVTISN